MRERRRWHLAHRWLGIGLGVWFALVGLTGSVLVFEDQIDAWLNPDLLNTPARGALLPPEEIFARAKAIAALGTIDRIRLPTAAGDVYRLQVRTSSSTRERVARIEAMFDPVSGALLGTRGTEVLDLSARHLLKTVYEFHRNVLLGNTGSNIVGVAGFALLASALSGFVLAWPKKREGLKRLIWINHRASATRVLFDVHRSTGAIFVALILLTTITGSTLVYVNYARDLVSVFSKVAPFPTIPWRQGSRDELAPFATVVSAVRNAYPDRRMTEIHIPQKRTAGYLFYLQRAGDEYRLGDTIVWAHPVTGEILIERSDRTRNAGEALMHWLFPLHSGSAFGFPGLVAMCLTGVTPLLMISTGLWVWQRKRRGQQIGSQRRQARAEPPRSSPRPGPHPEL